jgi:hypothetical protein
LPLLLGGNAQAERTDSTDGSEHLRGIDEEPFVEKTIALQRLNDARDAIDDRVVPVGDRHEAVHELEDAIEELEESMEPKLWLRVDGEIEGSRLDPKRGDHVFHEECECIEEIVEAIDDGEIEDEGLTKELFAIVRDLVLVDRTLAEIAINDAIAANGNFCDIQDALEDLKCGDELINDAIHETCLRRRTYLVCKAIDHCYRYAWKEAIHALRDHDDDDDDDDHDD